MDRPYILFDTRDFITTFVNDLKVPFGIVMDDESSENTNAIRIKTILNNKIHNHIWIFREDIKRCLNDNEINKFNLMLRKTRLYNKIIRK